MSAPPGDGLRTGALRRDRRGHHRGDPALEPCASSRESSGVGPGPCGPRFACYAAATSRPCRNGAGEWIRPSASGSSYRAWDARPGFSSNGTTAAQPRTSSSATRWRASAWASGSICSEAACNSCTGRGTSSQTHTDDVRKERCTPCDSRLDSRPSRSRSPFFSAQSSTHDHQAPAGRTDASAQQGAHARLEDLKWQPMCPELGADGPQAAILRVNPKTQATQLLIRMPKAMHVPVHWHSANETHTVIKGTMVFEHGGSRTSSARAASITFRPARPTRRGLGRRARVHHGRRRLGHHVGERSADEERSRPATADELAGSRPAHDARLDRRRCGC